jgi:hypothetical protein
MYLTISQEDSFKNIAFNAVLRENEIHNYQFNIDNYTGILTSLPQGDTPANIVQYLETPIEDLPAHIPLNEVQTIAEYQWRKRLNTLIRTETVEQLKSKSILSSLKAQLPTERFDELMTEALVKFNAQQNPQ